MHDLVIRGGLVFDGTGAAPVRGDVAIAQGRVVALGEVGQSAATIDAAGGWVLPGFVDLHTHYDLCLDWPDLSAHCLRQGITTVVGGNCGLGDADVAGVLAHAERARLGVHFGVLAPLGPLRSRVVPRAEDRAATQRERERLADDVARALDAGGLGVSWGPYHANGSMDRDEVAACLRVAAGRGKPFCIHRRSEGASGLLATEEAIGLARASGVRLQISHLKAAGRTSWDQLEPVLSCIDAARRDVDLAVDVYPYDASLTYLSAMLPDALKGAGRVHAELGAAASRAAACAGIERWFRERMGPERIVLLEPALSQVDRGSTLQEAAERIGCPGDPVQAALRLIEADPNGTGGWAIYREMMDPDHVEALLDLPFAAVASDAVPEDAGDRMSAHPRAFATFARALRRAEARGEAALADAIGRCTRFPAGRMGIDRGRIAVGEPADLLVLRDLEEGASYASPEEYPQGMAAVVVAGEVALRDGEPTGARTGEVLRT